PERSWQQRIQLRHTWQPAVVFRPAQWACHLPRSVSTMAFPLPLYTPTGYARLAVASDGPYSTRRMSGFGSSGRWPAHRGRSSICPLHRGPRLGRRDGLVMDVMRKATLGLIGSHMLSPFRCRSGPCPAPDKPAGRAELIAYAAPRSRLRFGGKV